MIIDDVVGLNEWSKKVISLKCDYCNEPFNKLYKQLVLYSDKSIINKDCCSNCRKFKNIEIKYSEYIINDLDSIIEYMVKQKTATISGIYSITSLNDGRKYIGSTADIFKRWKRHIDELEKNDHHSKTLQESYNRFGMNGLAFSVLELPKSSNDDLRIKEFSYIESLNPEHNTFKKIKARKDKNKLSCDARNNLSLIRHGENSSSAILKEKDIYYIKMMLLEGYGQSEIANTFSVDKATISSIKNKQTWKHISHPIDEALSEIKPNLKGENNGCSKLTESDIREIKSKLENGERMTNIAKSFNVSRTLISHIKRGKLWSHIS